MIPTSRQKDTSTICILAFESKHIGMNLRTTKKWNLMAVGMLGMVYFSLPTPVDRHQHHIAQLTDTVIPFDLDGIKNKLIFPQVPDPLNHYILENYLAKQEL